MSDRKSRIFATIVIILIVVAISFLFMTRENYVRYSFYDATGCQYIEVTKMENAKGENSIKHLSLYKYGYFKPCYTIPKSSAEGVFMAYNDDNDLLNIVIESINETSVIGGALGVLQRDINNLKMVILKYLYDMEEKEKCVR